jgi:hypothetical protein
MSHPFVLMVLLVETAVDISDEAQKHYNFVYVLRKLKILDLTEDHILWHYTFCS